jgi:serine/threonine protein kinase
MPTFGRYSLIRRIGTGGMAEIWKARAIGPAGFQKVLAIKKVLPDLAQDELFVQMFVEEAKLVAGLVHPNIVQVFDFGRLDDEYYLTMEYVAGSNLAKLLVRLQKEEARLSPSVAAFVAVEACKGLSYAHRKTDSLGRPLGIVHRDVTPHNVLVSFGGDVKVTDFGIARAKSVASRTTEGQVRGKLAYMSPEQLSGQALDHRTDLFALGVILYELATGTRFFAAETEAQVYSRVASYKGLTAEQISLMPPQLRPVLERALKVRREDRWDDARAMEAALNSVLEDGSLRARETLSSIVGSFFEDEMGVELSEEHEEPAHAAAGALGAMGVVPEGDTQKAATVVSEDPPRPPPRTESTRPGTTLVPRAPVVDVSESNVRVPKSAGRSRSWTFLALTGLAGLLAGGYALQRFLPAHGPAVPTPESTIARSDTPFPTSTPTPVVASAHTPAPASTRTPVAIATRTPAIAPTPRPTHVAVAPAKGFLFVTSRPWVEVWVDGERIARETPLRNYELAAGKHSFRFVSPTKAVVEKTLVVPPGRNLTLFVDVAGGRVDVDD